MQRLPPAGTALDAKVQISEEDWTNIRFASPEVQQLWGAYFNTIVPGSIRREELPPEDYNLCSGDSVNILQLNLGDLTRSARTFSDGKSLNSEYFNVLLSLIINSSAHVIII